MTDNSIRIEVEQTAEAREAALRGLAGGDRVVYHYRGAPEGSAAEGEVYRDEMGGFRLTSGMAVCGPSRNVNLLWRYEDPIAAVLAVIKADPLAGAKPGDVWGDPENFGFRAAYLPGYRDDLEAWLTAGPESHPDWESDSSLRELIRSHGWVKMIEGGTVIER